MRCCKVCDLLGVEEAAAACPTARDRRVRALAHQAWAERRQDEMWERVAAGETKRVLAAQYRLSPERVRQLVLRSTRRRNMEPDRFLTQHRGLVPMVEA